MTLTVDGDVTGSFTASTVLLLVINGTVSGSLVVSVVAGTFQILGGLSGSIRVTDQDRGGEPKEYEIAGDLVQHPYAGRPPPPHPSQAGLTPKARDRNDNQPSAIRNFEG